MRNKLLFLLMTFYSVVSAQNSDLLMKYNSGYYSSMGGTGLASVKYPSSMDMNPAALSVHKSSNLSLTQSAAYYSYNLLRMRDDIGTLENNWNNLIYNFDQFSFAMPYKDFSIGIGIFRKLTPRIENKKIATTYSDLFSQETSGNVYSVTAGLGYSLSNSLSLGISFNKYFGQISSSVRGDNHNLDADKWASMENDLSGINFKLGLIFKQTNWSAGFTIETPFNMKVKTSKQISENKLYEYLLPHYNEADWNQPMVVSGGISFYGIEELLIEADYELRIYKSSQVQINLYEFGGGPVWQNVKIFRIGAEYKPADWTIPVKAGYSSTPQLYYSNKSTGIYNTITSYNNTGRNIKHSYTGGTSFRLEKLLFDVTVEYSFVKWSRTLSVPQIIDDEYKEVNTSFTVNISYSF